MHTKCKLPVTRRSVSHDNEYSDYFDVTDSQELERDEEGPGGDAVDMGFRRESKTHRRRSKGQRASLQFAYKFGWFEMLVGIGSIFLFYVDIGSDIFLVVQYFWANNIVYAVVSLILTAGPSLITCLLGLHWYIIDYRRERHMRKQGNKTTSVANIYAVSTRRWIARFVFTVFQMGPVIRITEYMYNGKKYQTARTTEEQKHYYWQMLVDDVDACLLRLFECFLESAPQLMWQLYIWVTLKPHEDDVTVTTRAIALLSSWGSLAISLLSYHKSLRFSKKEKENMKKSQMPAFLIWRASEVGSRILCLALFASVFKLFVFAPILLHWVMASIWLMCQRTSFYKNVCLEKAFNVICGYVMIFCYINLREGHTRFRYIVFYMVFYLENGVMLFMWYLFTPDIGSWFHVYGLIVILILFVLHVTFQLLYYYCCHPSGEIELCLAIGNDGKTCWESLCYDLDDTRSQRDESPMVHPMEIIIPDPSSSSNNIKTTQSKTYHRNHSAQTFV